MDHSSCSWLQGTVCEPVETAAISCTLQGKPLLCGVSLLSFCTSQSVSMHVQMCVTRMQVLLTARVLIFFFGWHLIGIQSWKLTDKIKEAIFPLSSAFYSGETLGADIFVSWPCLCCFHSFLGSPCQEGNKKVTVCTRVHYLSRNKGVNCKHQKIIFVQ